MRAAIVGTGAISAEHLSFLRAKRGEHELVGVCDLSPAAARFAAERFGGQAYTDVRALLDQGRPDVVHVLTPAATHAKLVRDALDAGAHVICEKPLALSHGEVIELLAHADSRRRRLIEDHNYRFNSQLQALEGLVARGELGSVEEVEVRLQLGIREAGRYADPNIPHPSHRLPAGVIHEFVTHLAYLTLRFLPGSSFQRVTAAWSNHGRKGDGDPFRWDDLDALVIQDAVHARIRFSARARPDCFTVTVRGSKGLAETDLFLPHLRRVVPRPGGAQLSPLVNQLASGAELCRASVDNLRRKLLSKTPYEGLHTFLERTYAALVSGGTPPVSPEDVLRASALVDALLREENRA